MEDSEESKGSTEEETSTGATSTATGRPSTTKGRHSEVSKLSGNGRSSVVSGAGITAARPSGAGSTNGRPSGAGSTNGRPSGAGSINGRPSGAATPSEGQRRRSSLHESQTADPSPTKGQGEGEDTGTEELVATAVTGDVIEQLQQSSGLQQNTKVEMMTAEHKSVSEHTTANASVMKINVSSTVAVAVMQQQQQTSTVTTPISAILPTQSLAPKETMATTTAEPICQKCNEIYDDPRLLSCLHSFCKKCLHDLTDVVGSSNVIRCPVCRDTTPIPAEGIDHIQVNLYLEHESVIASIEARMMAPSKPECEECSREPTRETVSFCCTCVSFLCELCHAQHIVSRKSHLHHKVLTLDDAANIKAKLRQYMTFLPTTCPIHNRQEITFFCKECKVLLCIQCALSKHPGHRVEDLLDFVQRQKNVFCDDVRDMPDMIQKLDDLMNTGRTVCDNIKSREVSIDESISKVFEELHQALDMRKSALLQQCAEIVTSKLECLTDQIEELSLLKSSIITCNEFVTTSKEHFDVSEFVSILTILHKRIDTIKRKVRSTSMHLREDDMIHFNSDASAAINSISTMGSVCAAIKQKEKKQYTTSTPTPSSNSISLHDPINTIKTSNAYHAAVHRSGDYVVANHVGDSIEVYDSMGTRKLAFGRSGTRPGHFKRPLGVCIVGDIVYIVEYTGGRCQKIPALVSLQL